MVEAMYEATEGDAIITSDVGQHQMWAAQYYHFSEPRRWLNSGGLGTMGFGLPAAIGAKVACPDETVVCLAGDGSLIMNCQEFATAAQHEIPVKVFLMNNGHFGMVRQWQELFWEERYQSVEMGPSPDWPKLAEAFGWTGMQCTDKGELRDAMSAALETDGPVLLDVHVTKDENCYPMIPAGAAARDMVGLMGEPGTPDVVRLEDLEASRQLTGRKHILSLLVENKPGVLARIAGLFSRRGFNIDTLAVGPTEDPDTSRITLTLDGAVHPIDQVTKQLHKLVNVIKIRDMEPDGDRRPRDGAVPGQRLGREPGRDHAVRRDLRGQDRRRLAPLADDRGHRLAGQDRLLRAHDPPPRPDRDGAHGRGRDHQVAARALDASRPPQARALLGQPGRGERFGSLAVVDLADAPVVAERVDLEPAVVDLDTAAAAPSAVVHRDDDAVSAVDELLGDHLELGPVAVPALPEVANRRRAAGRQLLTHLPDDVLGEVCRRSNVVGPPIGLDRRPHRFHALLRHCLQYSDPVRSQDVTRARGTSRSRPAVRSAWVSHGSSRGCRGERWSHQSLRCSPAPPAQSASPRRSRGRGRAGSPMTTRPPASRSASPANGMLLARI